MPRTRRQRRQRGGACETKAGGKIYRIEDSDTLCKAGPGVWNNFTCRPELLSALSSCTTPKAIEYVTTMKQQGIMAASTKGANVAGSVAPNTKFKAAEVNVYVPPPVTREVVTPPPMPVVNFQAKLKATSQTNVDKKISEIGSNYDNIKIALKKVNTPAVFLALQSILNAMNKNDYAALVAKLDSETDASGDKNPVYVDNLAKLHILPKMNVSSLPPTPSPSPSPVSTPSPSPVSTPSVPTPSPVSRPLTPLELSEQGALARQSRGTWAAVNAISPPAPTAPTVNFKTLFANPFNEMKAPLATVSSTSGVIGSSTSEIKNALMNIYAPGVYVGLRTTFDKMSDAEYGALVASLNPTEKRALAELDYHRKVSVNTVQFGGRSRRRRYRKKSKKTRRN